ncbi:MAG: transposase [Chloroflexi bacterium]|nr:transposase [Chloroflexota bacterium]
MKAHAICGVVSNIITAAEVTTTDSADAPQLPLLLARTDEHFNVRELSGDKAYLSRTNLHAIAGVGARGFIPFKSNSVARSGHHRRDLLWERAFHYFNLKRAEFLDHYHKRSNIETTFAMVKSKFGHAVRSKSPAAQINEVLLKFVAHNICCLIQSAFEMGVDPLTMAATEHTSPATKLAGNHGF